MLNGPPASGKSALASRFVADRALALNLDVDVVRGLLGRWSEQPTDAGLLARRMALEMARVALASGRDVIVAQFLTREEFIVDLADTAARSGAVFVEVILTATKDQMRTWFAARAANPSTSTHADAQTLVDRLGGSAALDEMYDRFNELSTTRVHARSIPARAGPIEPTYAMLQQILAEADHPGL